MPSPAKRRAFLLALAAVAIPLPGRAASPADCAALAALSLPDTAVTSATWNAATPALPEHCRIRGEIGPGTIGFAVQLPTAWNGRLYHQGGGGYVGAIPNASAGLARGYATVATDTGHQGGGLDGSWALGDPQALVDFGYRAIHVATVTAKEVARAYYGSAPTRAYFLGCSRGGGQALMEAQRFPDDFDGILAGAPAYDWTEFMTGFNWNTRAIAAGPIPVGKLAVVASAVLASCDRADGLADGLVLDPRRCTFDPIALLCPGGDGPDCLTPAQVSAMRRVYSGPRDSRGTSLSPGFPVGSEDGPGGWAAWISGGLVNPSLQHTFQDQFFRYLVFGDPAYDPFTLNHDTDPGTPEFLAAGAILNATDPDLSAFEARGGKLIVYHGTNDHALSLYKTIQYWDEVAAVRGGESLQGFFRLFFVPGMHHCGGGPGLNTFDGLEPLVEWVEQGKAPHRIVASAAGNAMAGRTRPLCPYPKEARYQGHGSVDDAGSFVCAVPSDATRR